MSLSIAEFTIAQHPAVVLVSTRRRRVRHVTREDRVGDSVLRMALASGCGASRHATVSIRQARGKVVGRAVASSSLCGHSRSLLSFSLLRIFCVWPARCARFLFPFSFSLSSFHLLQPLKTVKTAKPSRQTGKPSHKWSGTCLLLSRTPFV